MIILKEILFAFFSAAGFAVIFNIPRKSIFLAGLCGSTGWIIYYLLKGVYNSEVIATFFGALAVGLGGEILARVFKKPATLYIVPGMIVLVPGYSLYYAMLHVANRNYTAAAGTGSEAVFIAVSVACGLLMATSVVRIFSPRKLIKD